jgi:hypothetical protein
MGTRERAGRRREGVGESVSERKRAREREGEKRT